MRGDITEKPISIIGPLFGLCVTFWSYNLVQFVSDSETWPWLRDQNATAGHLEAAAIITLLSGIVFLMDLLCILWWYARYIYVVQPGSTLWTHLLDFTVCGMFATAANAWDKPQIFLATTVLACLLLMMRFWIVYHGADSTDTDKIIVNWAGIWLAIAAVGVSIPTLLLMVLVSRGIIDFGDADLGEEAFNDFFLPGIPGLLSLIGIILTLALRNRISVAASIHECRRQKFVPMQIVWPDEATEEQRQAIRKSTRAGLSAFDHMFEIQGKKLRHVVLPSRVHAGADLMVQSYILAIGSCNVKERDTEVRKKAFIVGLSHWLDDLVDGRRERSVLRAHRRGSCLREPKKATDIDLGVTDRGVDQKSCEALFARIYRRQVKIHTTRRVYGAMMSQIEAALGDATNRGYMMFGLNRVALGSALFSPAIRRKTRDALLTAHNTALRTLAARASDVNQGWRMKVSKLLEEIDNDEHGTGRTLLGLSTKTAQELAMSSEHQQLNFPLSVLYSLLYAPLLYLHDIQRETDCGEMVALDNFDVNYPLIVPWLLRARDLCRDPAADDHRQAERMAQLAMAYHCFGRSLPHAVAGALEAVYLDHEREPGRAVLKMPGAR